MSKKQQKKKLNASNFKIEALEPRLMMDANVDYNDFVNEISDYNYASALSSTLSEMQQNVDQSFTEALGKLNLANVSSVQDFFSSLTNEASSKWNSLLQTISAIPQNQQNSLEVSDIASVINNADIGILATADNNTLSLSVESSGSTLLNGLELGDFDVVLNNLSANIAASAMINIQFADATPNDNEDIFTVSAISGTALEAEVSVADLNKGVGYMNMSLNDVADVNNDVELSVSYDSTNGFDSQFLMDVELSLNSGNLPFRFKNNGQIKITENDGGDVVCSIPEIEFTNSQFDLQTILGIIDEFEIPFLKQLSFEIGGDRKRISDIGLMINEYWTRASLAMNAAVSRVENVDCLNMETLRKCFGMITNLSAVSGILDKIEIISSNSSFDILSTNSFSASDIVDLSSGEIKVRFTPNLLDVAGDVDLGLFKLGGVKADCFIELNLGVSVNENGRLSFTSVSLNEVGLSVKTTAQDENVHIGLFDAEVKNCGLDYNISVKNVQNELKWSSDKLEISFGTLELKSGSVCVCKVNENPTDNTFKYSFEDAEWKMPDAIKQFVSLSGDTLQQQLLSYLNALQSSLRSLIRDKVKLGVFDGSVDKIVDVIDKIDKVVYGSEDSTNPGLVSVLNGLYKLNFSSVEDFVEIFDSKWMEVFGLTPTDLSENGIVDGKVCSLIYIDLNGNEIVPTSGEVSEGEIEDEQQPDFKKYRIDFNIFFKIDEEMNLDFANKLGSILANVSTDGTIGFVGKAGFKFSLGVDFSSEKISADTTIGSILGTNGSDALENHDYLTGQKDFTTYNVDKALSFSVVETISGEDGEPDVKNKYSINVDDGIIAENSFSVTLDNEVSNEVSFELTSDQRILVLCDNPFEIQSGKDADSFADLKLIDSRLQTTYQAQNVNKESGEISLSFLTVNFETRESPDTSYTLSVADFNTLVNKGVVHGADLVAQLNDYLSLLDDNGCSVMGKFGLYVIDASESESSYNIRFGCDQARLKIKDKNSGTNNYKYFKLQDANTSDIQYVRVSGVLRATGVVYSEGVSRGFVVKADSNGKIVESLDYQMYFDVEDDDSESPATSAQSQVEYLNGLFETDGEWYSGKFEATYETRTVFVNDAPQTIYVVHVANKTVDGKIQRMDAEGNAFGVVESDKVLHLEVVDGTNTSDVYVNTRGCLTPSSLANAIEDALEHSGEDSISAVSFINERIVFTVDSGVTIAAEGFENFVCEEDNPGVDFVVNVGAMPKSIDFELLVSGSDDTLVSVITAINQQLSGTDVEIWYCDRDESGNPALDENNNIRYWDHLEFRGEDSFSLENFGASQFLKKMGFDAVEAKEYGDGSYRIIGSALLGRDWSKLISLGGLGTASNMEMYADLSLTVNNAEISADVSIVGVELALNGNASIHAGFEASNLDANASKGQNDFQNWQFTPTLRIDSSAFTLTPTVNLGVGDGGTDFSLSPIILSLTDSNSETGADEFGLSVDTSAFINSVENAFGNFSMENVYAILESLVKQISSFVEQSDVKIPVINKSVGELVNVANDIRDVVTKMRKDGITNLKSFEKFFIEHLSNSGLVNHTPAKKLFEINFVDSLYIFDFNIEKIFSTVQQLNFGKAEYGVSGNADLGVEGSFWLNISAKASFANGKFDLILNAPMDFGASVEIIGEKLSFNLGIDGDAKLLKNLITVGSNKDEAFVYARAELLGQFGSNDLLSTFNASSAYINYDVPIAAFGKLPISVCGYSLGDVLIGKCDGSGVLLQEYADADSCRNGLASLFTNYRNAWLLNNDSNPDNDVEYSTPGAFYVAQSDDIGFNLVTRDNESTEAGTKFSDCGGSFVVDMSSVYERILEISNGDIDWFDKIKLAVVGLNNLFDSLESSMNSGLMSNVKSVPVVGNALSSGVDFLGDLKHKVLEPFSNFVYESTGLSAKMLAEKMNVLFDGYFYDDSKTLMDGQNVTLQILPGEGGASWSQVNNSGTYYRSSQDENRGNYAEWFFRLGKDYSLGSDIGLDFGFPGLGLEAEGGVNLCLNWCLEFGFGVSENGGFYFIFGDENEIDVTARASLGTKILGKLAGLGLLLDTTGDHEADIELSFGVDIDGKKTTDVNPSYATTLIRKKTVQEQGKDDVVAQTNYKSIALSDALGQIPQFEFDATVLVNAGITVGFATDVLDASNVVDDSTPKFPNIMGEFVFDWNKDGIQELGFNKIKIDMGEFISGVLGPIVSRIQKVVEPLKPLIDFLTTPFPVLDDLGIEITPLDLAKQYSQGKFDDSMIYAIKDLIDMADKISKISKSSSNLFLEIGNFVLIGGKGDEFSAIDFLKGLSNNTSLNDSIGSYITPKKDLSGKDIDVAAAAGTELAKNGLNVGNGAWRFFWDKPQDIFKLLLGQDIMLVEYDMPKLSFDFNWDTFVRIWGPLGARLGISLNATIDLGFGYDTLGIRQWADSGRKDYGRLLNGFYVNDLDKNGDDKAELSFYGGLTAAAELNAGVSAGVGGGVGINVGFNLNDPNKDGKIRLNEISQLFKSEGLFGFFDVEGAITAKLYAYVDLLFYTKKWDITGDITLFEFDFTHELTPQINSENDDGNVVANVGSNASSRVADHNDLGINAIDEVVDVTIDGNKLTDQFGNTTEIKTGGKYIVNAENGNDKIVLKTSNKAADFDIEINGGDGDDYIDLSRLQMASNRTVFIWGGAGNDTIIGADGLNIIFGDIGTVRKDDDKYIIEANVDPGVAGNDIILGGSKKDIIFGGAGDDQIDGGAGADFIFGDGGRYDETGSIPQIDRTDISLDGGKDTLIGGDDDDVIYGGGGDDHVDGGAGNDEIYGERGHDRILGGSGNDTIHGGEGMDIVFGDRINSTPMDLAAPFAVDMSADKKTAAFSQEFIDAQFKKNDVKDTEINENEFKIKVDTNNTIYTKYTNNLKNKINDGILTHSSDLGTIGSDTIYGDDGNDLLFGDDGDESSITVDGADKIYGGIGNDIIDGDGGNDTISGGIDNDLIYGGADDDIIDGGAGNDMLYGDNGVTDYEVKADGKTVNANKIDNAGGNDKVVFGDNLGLHGKIYANAKSQTTGGNDKITTGPGMDFVDGQGGSDVVTVNLMGESSVGYANVTDSGIDGSDTLVVEGTESDDNLLVRRNKKTQGEPGDLGFVAMLPTEPDPNNLSLNTNIERVNFTSAIETLNLNANGGNDTVAVDGTASMTNINGGAGNDTVLVGQLYNSERDNQTPASIQPVDVFRTQQTNEEKYLSDGVSKNTTLNVDGDIGDDTFAALNNAGSLNMSGGKGDDKFSVYGFQDKNDKTIVRGAMSIDGGLGNDSMFVRGTNGDDTVIVSKDGLLSDIVSVKASGVESTTFDAAAGDDLFNVIGNNKGEITNLNGGKGNDTFSMGGLDADHTLRSSNTDGQSCDIKYELLDSENKVLESKTESYTLYDTSSEPVVFVSSEANSINVPEITLSEVNNGVGVAFFYVHYSGDLLNGQSVGTVKVNLSAPMLSAKALKSGAREIMLAEVSGSDTDFSSNWNLCSTLPVELNSSKKFAKIAVCLFADALEESESLKSITISSECDNVALTKSVSSLPIKISADGAVSRSADGLLAEAEEFVVSENSVQLGNVANGLDPMSNISAYIVGARGFLTQQTKSAFDAASDKTNLYCVENGVLYLDSALTKKNLVVLYRASSLRIDGSKAHLVYDDVDASKIKVEYKAEGSTTASEILARGAAEVEGVTYVAGVEYELQGDTIVFYNSINGRMMTLHGELTISPRNNGETDVFLPSESDMPASVPSIVDTAPSIHIEDHSTILAESGSLSSVEYTVSFRGNFDGRSSVKVRISVLDAVSSVNQDGTYNLTKEMQFVDANGNVDPATNGEYIELTFTPENPNQAQTVRLRAKTDTVSEEYGFVTVHKTEKNLVDDIDGAVYAFGMGQSVELDTDNPSMLSYAHKVNEGSSYVEASTLNEKNDYASDKLFGFTSVTGKTLVITIESANSILTGLGINLSDSHSFEGKTIRLVASSSNGIVVGEGNDKKTYRESDWFKIVSCVANGNQYTLTLNESVSVFDANNSNVLFSGSKDYLFIDEDASVDRLFANNQGDEENETSSLNAFAVKNGNVSSEERAEFGNSAASIEQNIQDAERTVMDFDEHAVRFEHDDIGKRGIAAAQMEYAEYNLGSGSDTVNVNKTIYREDGFQTFTVVNTGSGVTGGNATDDTVNINSYAEESATEIASGTSAVLSNTADNGGATYNYTLTGSAEAFNVAKSALDVSEKIYVDATLSDGTTQRREVTTLEQIYFVVARAFTLANGVTVDSVSFKHGYSGDGQLVVNAQGGDDIINATSNAVTRNDMVVFGGLGDDTINMNRGGIAFGDRGQVLYGEDPQNPVTVLGSTNSGLDYTTGISKNHGDDTAANGPVHRLQTDGVRRGAYEIHSMNDSEGGSDTINVGGTDSVVIGGADGDTITVSGNNNIALGDNGSVKYYNAANVGAVYGDSLNLGLHTVETTSDSVGDVDTVTISGNKNVAMGGEAGDTIGIGGSDNVVIGDGGRYTVLSDRLIAESKSDTEGGSDTITTGDGKNAIIGGTDADTITTGAGNDIIVGDGGKVIMDTGRNALMVTNKDRNITGAGLEDGSAGGDTIDAGNGRNVVFGGLDSDHIKTGEGEDVVFGDNGFATFQGNASESGVETRTEATLSFNFQGASQTGLSSEAVAGALNATHGDDYRSANWNNVGGNLAGTYGNDDREVVRFDDGTRASAVSVSYGGIESHRNTDTDNRINLQAYGHNFANASTDADAALMNAGLMTTAPNAQCDNRLEVVVDGLAQYFTEYRVVVYLDIPDSHSAPVHSVRKVSLYVGDSSTALQSFYVDDAEGENFDGGYERATATTASAATYANYAVFTVSAANFADNFRVVIEDAFPDQHPNGKNLPGIAAIQVRGDLHAQDVAVSTQLNLGGDDIVSTGGGDDIVVGGAGSDYMATFGELAGGIRDNDLVFGDSVSLRFEDRLGTGDTMVSSAHSLDPDADDLVQGVSFDDRIVTGDGNDTVVGGLGGDKILAGSQSELTQLGIAQAFYGDEATAESLDAANGPAAIRNLEQLKDATVEGRKVLSVNFTTRGADDSTMASGYAGVVHDTGWNNLYLYNGHLYTHEGNENSTTPVLRYSEGGTVTDSSVGISLTSYDSGTTDQGQNGSLVFRTSTELDGDTANSRLFAGYTAAQQQQDIHVSLTNLSSFRGEGGTCDVYVYLGADDSDTDAHSHIYEIQGSEDGSRYLNDWKGHAFDGDYREATCRSRSDALANLAVGATPMVELIGNYVVFHNVAGDSFDLYIRNLHTEGGQWPMNLPVIAAIQVVAGSGRADAAVGGDHDRDLVFGDSAALTFDMDVPYAAGEDLADFANINRVNGASSVALDDGLYALGADDAIYTGMDRDVVVAGEGLDTVTLGSGDDVALGDNASLVLEHNNPVGVFRPDVETVLESNNYQADTGDYLGSPTVDAGDIQDKFEDGDVPGVTLEASANGGTDTFTDATDKDWTVQQEVTPGTISRTIDISSGAQVITFAEGETVLLVSDTWPGKDNPWWNPNIVLISDGQGHSVPALAWEWDVNGTTMTASTQEGYYFTVDIPDTPNGDNRYEIRVTALTAGTAVISIG